MKTPKQIAPFLLKGKSFSFIKLSATETTLEVPLPSTEFEHQALMITLPFSTNNLFGHKARSQSFLKVLLILLKLRTRYMVQTSLRIMIWKFKKPLALVVQ